MECCWSPRFSLALHATTSGGGRKRIAKASDGSPRSAAHCADSPLQSSARQRTKLARRPIVPHAILKVTESMRVLLAFLIHCCFVSSVLCFSSVPQEPERRALLFQPARSLVNMHTPATAPELLMLTSNQCTLCFELRDVCVCHLDYRNVPRLSSDPPGASTTCRKTRWDRILCHHQRLREKHVLGRRRHASNSSRRVPVVHAAKDPTAGVRP